MRIISGKFKFYNIELEKKESFTPTSSFLRENIFNILPALINFNKLMVADVFAGSGSLGLEALSRDVKFAYFNDFDAKNIKRIQKHCEKLQIQNCEISQLHFLQFFLKLQQQKSQLDLVFIDPPFDRPDLINKSMELLLTGNLLNENAVLVVISPQLINFADVNLKLCKLKKYAKKFIYFFQKKKNALNMPTRWAQRKFLIISGPSGVGKKQIIQNLINNDNFKLSYSTSVTTRLRRHKEIDGEDYYFVNVKQFEKLIAKNDFIEYVKYINDYYGTSWSKTQNFLTKGQNILFEIEIVGAEAIKKKIPQAIWIYIFPPSLNELKRRLEKRSTENKNQIQQRISESKKEIQYIKQKQNYDFSVINNDVNETIEKITKFLEKQF